jgi:hypothetical protein
MAKFYECLIVDAGGFSVAKTISRMPLIGARSAGFRRAAMRKRDSTGESLKKTKAVSRV